MAKKDNAEKEKKTEKKTNVVINSKGRPIVEQS